MIERQWIIQDGKISETVLKYISQQKGKKVLIFKTYKQSRTNQQNSALHLWFTQLSEALNQDGFDVRATISQDIDMMWTPVLVKELLWRPTQKLLFNKKSTTSLDKMMEIDKIYDVINKVIGERCGIHIPFPNWEDYLNELKI